jgi:hypothetical protein
MNNSDDQTRAVLASIIWVGFIGIALILMIHGVPKGNEFMVGEQVTRLCAMAALVTNYYFKRA